MNTKLIAQLREYFLMAKITKLLTKEQYKEYKSRVNAYERDWRKKHPTEHTKKSKELLDAIKGRKKVKAIWSEKKKKVVKTKKVKTTKKVRKDVSGNKMPKGFVEIPKATEQENEDIGLGQNLTT